MSDSERLLCRRYLLGADLYLRFKDTKLSVPEIAGQLNVDAIVEPN